MSYTNLGLIMEMFQPQKNKTSGTNDCRQGITPIWKGGASGLEEV